MIIGKIEDGIVLDHIKAGRGMELYRILGLDNLDCQVALIKNADSGKMGRKDIIKIDRIIDIDLDAIGYVDPGITVNIIKGGELIFQDSMEQLNLRRRPYLLLRTGDDRAAAQVLQPLRPKWLPHGVALENPADGLAAQAVEALVQSGIPIYRVEERQRSLEDVFLELTGKELSL